VYTIPRNHGRDWWTLVLVAAVCSGTAGSVAGYMAGRATARHETLGAASGVTIVSDRKKKENFRQEDPQQVLERVSRLPIESWNYRTQSASVRHLGPTAQDFYGAFRLGESDTTITATDMAAVSLLAVQALQRKVERLEAQLGSGRPVAAQAAPVQLDSRKRR
jgi:hypothetical protein